MVPDDDEAIDALYDGSSLLPPEEMDPSTRLEMALNTLERYRSKGIPLGDEVDHVFKAETALGEGDLRTFDRHLRLALQDIVEDEDVDDALEWCGWLLSTLARFEEVPPSIMDVYNEAEDMHRDGEPDMALALVRRIKRTAVDRLGAHWVDLRGFTKGMYKAVKKDLHRDTRRHVKRLMSAADTCMYADGHVYRRKALRHIREVHRIVLPRTTVLGRPA